MPPVDQSLRKAGDIYIFQSIESSVPAVSLTAYVVWNWQPELNAAFRYKRVGTLIFEVANDRTKQVA